MRVFSALLEFPLCWVCDAIFQETLIVDNTFDETTHSVGRSSKNVDCAFLDCESLEVEGSYLIGFFPR